MDIELARTFLEIVETGNFIGASKRLNVTQSTISMRIRSLEETLGRSLFVRGRSSVTLTAAGIPDCPQCWRTVQPVAPAHAELVGLDA